MSDNQQRAADIVAIVGAVERPAFMMRELAAALDAAEARGRAEGWDQGRAEARNDHGCLVGCQGGACEVCPCCSAGWCVFGLDGIPEDADDLDGWIEVASEHNPMIPLLLARGRAELAGRVRELADELNRPQFGAAFQTIADRLRALVTEADRETRPVTVTSTAAATDTTDRRTT